MIKLRGSNPRFINQSLYPYARMLWFKSKRLHDYGKINDYFISSGNIKLELQENSKPLTITNAKDF